MSSYVFGDVLNMRTYLYVLVRGVTRTRAVDTRNSVPNVFVAMFMGISLNGDNLLPWDLVLKFLG